MAATNKIQFIITENITRSFAVEAETPMEAKQLHKDGKSKQMAEREQSDVQPRPQAGMPQGGLQPVTGVTRSQMPRPKQ